MYIRNMFEARPQPFEFDRDDLGAHVIPSSHEGDVHALLLASLVEAVRYADDPRHDLVSWFLVASWAEAYNSDGDEAFAILDYTNRLEGRSSRTTFSSCRRGYPAEERYRPIHWS